MARQRKEQQQQQQQQQQQPSQVPPPPQKQQQPQQQGWQHMVAGSVAGCSAVLLLHPFDVIKTRLQVQDGLPGQLPAYRGTLDAARTILRTEGWLGLYAGLAPSLLGSTVAWGTYLYLYEQIKAWHRQRQGIGQPLPLPPQHASMAAGGKAARHGKARLQLQQQQQHDSGGGRLSAGWNLLSAAQAGAIVCVLTNPIWLVKTRLALQQRCQQAAAASVAAGGVAAAPTATAYRGMLDALGRIGREEGLPGLYKGFGPSLLLQTTHGAIQFAAYEEFKVLAARLGRGAGEPDRPLGSAEVSLYGAASKFLAAVSTYPTQVVRSRLQQRSEGRALVYTTTWQAASVTWQREGLAGFYRGLFPSLLRVLPQSAITLTVYEGVVKLLNPPAADDDGEGEWAAATSSSSSSRGAQKQQQAAAGGGGSQPGPLQQLRQRLQWRQTPLLTDGMSPLEIAADAQAEQ